MVLSFVTTTRRVGAEHVETDLVELEPDLGGDDLTTGGLALRLLLATADRCAPAPADTPAGAVKEYVAR